MSTYQKYASSLLESKVTYTPKAPFVKFRVKGAATFDDVKKSAELKKHMGPHTIVLDETKTERIAKSPGDNKWNAIRALYGSDEDEIVCAKAFEGEWICAAINVLV